MALASLSDEERPGSLVGSRIPERGNQISVLAVKNLKLAAFVFKSMKCCSKPYGFECVNSRAVLEFQHQWELKQKKTDDIDVS